jgi:NAD(P)-dependent dehydrogenase (short-subunit alcohol dehydrogenase family)
MGMFGDKVAFITGGASGIGRALGEALARDGAAVVLADLNRTLAEDAAATITRRGGRARAVALDVRDAGAFRAAIDETVATCGRLDYLFNNAGICVTADARDLRLEHWREVLDVNLNGVIHGVDAAYPVMVRQGFGHIVNTASLAGLLPTPGILPYVASKHAVVGLSTSLRCEAAPHGVRVSVVCPGLIDTPIVRNSRYVNVDVDALLAALPVKPYDVGRCAQAILEGVRRNRPIIVVTWQAQLFAALWRLSPPVVLWIAERMSRQSDRFRRTVT